MTEFLIGIADQLLTHKIISVVALCVVADTLFGCFRAIKQHSFNSCFGIDGAIRKVVMLISLVFLVIFDTAVNINLIAFVPAEILEVVNIKVVGTTEFFGFLYVAYEIVSILKNLTMCGLPTAKILENVRKFLSKYTNELPDEN